MKYKWSWRDIVSGNLQMVKFFLRFCNVLQRILIISLQPQIIMLYIQASTSLAKKSWTLGAPVPTVVQLCYPFFEQATPFLQILTVPVPFPQSTGMSFSQLHVATRRLQVFTSNSNWFTRNKRIRPLSPRKSQNDSVMEYQQGAQRKQRGNFLVITWPHVWVHGWRWAHYHLDRWGWHLKREKGLESWILVDSGWFVKGFIVRFFGV